MKFTFGPVNMNESLILFNFLHGLRGVKKKKGDTITIPKNVNSRFPLNSFCLLFNARPSNMPGELVITKGFHVHSVWTQPIGAEQCVNIDITREGDNMECKDKGEDQQEIPCKDLRGSSPSPKSTQVGGDHYSKMKIQPIDFITANGIGYIEGIIIKYVCRYKSKNGVEDLKKAQHYLQMLIEREERDQNE
jgi:bbp48|nr:MAG TPA: nucelotide kinase [Caudoviricetes sp.]